MALRDSITEKTGLPLWMVLSLVAAVTGGVASYADTKADVRHLEDTVAQLRREAVETKTQLQSEIAELRSDLKTMREQGTQHEIRIQRSEDNYANILKGLGKLEEKFDRGPRVRTAGGR